MDTVPYLPFHRAPRAEAFAIARDLEHAGISTVLKREADEYSVLVQATDADRAYAHA